MDNRLSVHTLSAKDQKILTLMSEGMRDLDICLSLGLTESAFHKALERIKERAGVDTNDAGRYYERALRMNAEAERRSVESRFAALMESCPQAVLVVEGRSGIIRQANAKAGHLFRHPLSELIGMKVERLVQSNLQEVHNAYRIGFLTSIRKREMGYHPPIFALRGDGTTLEIAIALTATTANDDVMVLCTEFEAFDVERARATADIQSRK